MDTTPSAAAPAHRANQGCQRLAVHQVWEAAIGADAVPEGITGRQTSVREQREASSEKEGLSENWRNQLSVIDKRAGGSAARPHESTKI